MLAFHYHTQTSYNRTLANRRMALSAISIKHLMVMSTTESGVPSQEIKKA